MIKLFGETDTGLVRKINQDRFECGVLSDKLAFAVLCDGMGGQNGGHVASEITAKFVADMLRRDLHDNMSEMSLRAVVESAVAGANALVHEAAAKDENLQGMGTTLLAAVIADDRLYVGYVGDSRVYTATPEQERQLTKDHTVVQMLLDIGEISEKDAASHPKRHYITRAIGVSPSVELDFLLHKLAPDEIVLLCSDGLYHYLEPGGLYEALLACIRAESARGLVDLALAGGGSDNVTVIVAANLA